MEVPAEPILNDSRKDTKESVTVVASREEDQSSGEGERLFPLYTILHSYLPCTYASSSVKNKLLNLKQYAAREQGQE